MIELAALWRLPVLALVILGNPRWVINLIFLVSYTTDDLLFDWEQEVPLVVDESIELPQHNLVDTSLGDCTKVYST
ncbi:hypothetical protein TNCV_425131, partial [Trichonephila clavipes]